MRLRVFIMAIGLFVFNTNTWATGIKSISKLAFGPDGILFAADWKDAKIYAIPLGPVLTKTSVGPFNILDLELVLSRSLGVDKLTVEDMAVRPGTGEVYLAVGMEEERKPAIVVITNDRKVRRVDLNNVPKTSILLKNSTTSKFNFWNSIPERSFTVTDMKWYDGELYVAGLSNQDFSSTLRRIPYPFTNKQMMTSIEIYHATHNQLETRAPIRTMAFANLGDRPHLIAAYTCTPLVTIALEELKNNAHVKGKTIAELGYGNTPADMITYRLTDQGKTEDYILLVNYERGANLMSVAQIAAANAKPGIDKPIPFGQIVGVDPVQAPLVGTVRLDELDDKFLIAVRRQLEKNTLELVTFDKKVLIRIGDFVSDYTFPQYRYHGKDWQLKYLKPVQDMLMEQEGYSGFIKTSK